MLPRLSVANQRQTATKRVALCCGFVVLSYLAIVGFGRLQRTQASENILPDRQVSAPPTKIQPKLVASYGKLPLSFEANQGQTGARVRFLAHGGGYTIFLTADEAVLTLKKSSVVSGQSSVAPTFRSARARVAPTFRSADAGLKSAATASVGKPTTDNGPRTTGSVLRMKLVGANAKATVTGAEELPGKSNYFIGNDPKKWRTNVPSYAQVKYEGVYPGVDLVYYGNQRQLEYDFVVGPGADPNQIKLSFAGAEGMRVDAASGDLVLEVGDDEVRFQKPAVYQPAVTAAYDRRRRSQSAATAELDGTFVLASNNQVAFRVAGYDPKRALVIDPVLTYSTYLGGSTHDEGFGIAVDAAGSAYVTGLTYSTDFPTTAGAFQTTNGAASNGGYNAFVAKLNSAGSALVYSTYLGGSGEVPSGQMLGGDWGQGIAVDSSGNAYVTGVTTSTNFPTVNPFQATNKAAAAHPGNDTAFVAKLNSTGSALVYSTYLGGSEADEGFGIAVDSAGNAYVTGATQSRDFPTANPLQATNEEDVAGYNYTGFVAKLNTAGSALLYSTYLGGSGSGADECLGIAVDSASNAYVTGLTYSTDFPTVNPFQATNKAKPATGSPTAFVAKLNSTGSALVYSTYLGGSIQDSGNGIPVDSSGNAYVTGLTYSTDFPTANPLQATCGDCAYDLEGEPISGDAFVAKLNPAGSALVYSTYLGGSTPGLGDWGFGVAADSAGNAYVTGQTSSGNFPTVNPIQAECNSCRANSTNAFVAKLNPAGSALVYSTYLGGSGGDAGNGIAVDAVGNAFVTGDTGPDFPTVNALQATYSSSSSEITGGGMGFVAKIGAVTLSPSSLSFSNQMVGTTSPAQPVTLSNIGNANLTISSIAIAGSVTGDFAVAATGTTCSTSAALAPGASCTINVTFTPTIVGSESASLTISDNIAGGPVTVPLSGTGVPLPAPNVSPTSLSFNNQLVGTTSTPQPVTVTNTSPVALSISSLTISSGWTQSNNCLPSIAPNASCTNNVSFLPTAPGNRTGALTLTDYALNSPQTIALSGTGQDFTLAAASGSPTSAAVAPGQSATYTLSAASEGALDQSVSLTCTGAPSEATCTVPNPVTVWSSATNVTITVTTTAPSLSTPRSRPLPPVPPLSPGLRGLLMLALVFAAMAWAIGRRNQPGVSRWKSAMVPLAWGLLLTLALAGCGGSARVTNPGTPPGTYTLTVTGTAGSGSSALSHSMKLTLTVS